MIAIPMISLEVECEYCGDIHIVSVNEFDFNDWKSGSLIQDAMPYLNESQKQLLISQMCDECWNRMYDD